MPRAPSFILTVSVFRILGQGETKMGRGVVPLSPIHANKSQLVHRQGAHLQKSQMRNHLLNLSLVMFLPFNRHPTSTRVAKQGLCFCRCSSPRHNRSTSSTRSATVSQD